MYTVDNFIATVTSKYKPPKNDLHLLDETRLDGTIGSGNEASYVQTLSHRLKHRAHHHFQLIRVYFNYSSLKVAHNHLQSVVTHVQVRVMDGCPAIGVVPIKNNRYMTTVLLNYCVLIDCFTLDKLLSSLELALLARLQEVYFWIYSS